MTKSQNQFVLDHLIDHGYITDAVAQSYRIRRLASRIHDLTTVGVAVRKEVRKDDLGQRYTLYTLEPAHRDFERRRRAAGYSWDAAPSKNRPLPLAA